MRATPSSSSPILAACLAAAVALAAGPAGAQNLQVELRPLAGLPAATEPADQAPRRRMLPDGVVSRGEGDIRSAWLVEPTKRYGHGVLGDAIEAAGLRVETASGKILTLMLGDNEVFEDRIPRLVDLDRDGRTEVLLVKSHLSLGSRLALAAVAGDSLAIVAEGEPLGRAFRWLNPVGVGDFNGDGRWEVAHVETPHIGGTLVLSRLEGGRLVAFQRVEGFSNHRMGSPELGLSAIVDANRDGIQDLIVPDNTRTRLRVVTFAGGPMRELALVELGAEVTSSLQVVPALGSGRPEVAMRLASGQALGLLLGP